MVTLLTLLMYVCNEVSRNTYSLHRIQINKQSMLPIVPFGLAAKNWVLKLWTLCFSFSNASKIPITEVTRSQMVSYDADRDLLPLIRAHCQYSLAIGQGTLVEYDWAAIQRHVIDRLIRGKSLVIFKVRIAYGETITTTSDHVLVIITKSLPYIKESTINTINTILPPLLIINDRDQQHHHHQQHHQNHDYHHHQQQQPIIIIINNNNNQ